MTNEMINNKCKWFLFIALLCCTCCSVQAANYYYNDSDPNNHLWSSKYNWEDNILPTDPIDKVYFNDGGECIIDASAGDISTSSHVYLANGNDANMVVTDDAGAFTVGGYLMIGYSDGDAGYAEINGGTCSFKGDFGLGIGWKGPGTFILNDGTVNTTSIRMPQNSQTGNSANRLEIHGGTLTAADEMIMGTPASGALDSDVLVDGGVLGIGWYGRIGSRSGHSTFTLSGDGQVHTFTSLTVGYAEGSDGTLIIDSGASLLTVGVDLNAGLEMGSNGVIEIADCNVIVDGDIRVSGSVGANGSFSMTGGIVHAAHDFVIRQQDSVTIDGGSIVADNLALGADPDSAVLFNINGGNFACRGDDRAHLLGLLYDGYLAGFGVAGALRFEYDESSDLTTFVPDLNELKKATNPSPGAEETIPFAPYDSTFLEWVAGDGAVSHNVYLGMDASLVAANDASTFQGNVVTTSFDPGNLSPDTVYYWKVDEVQGDASVISGNVWAFYLNSSLEIDNFEDYDLTTRFITDSWTVTSGTVELASGLLDYYEGAQAMLVTGTAASTVATFDIDPDISITDLMTVGIDVIVLYFKGTLSNSSHTMSLTLEDASGNTSTVVYSGDAGDVISYNAETWYKWIIDLNDFAGIDMANVDALRLNLNNPGATKIYIDKIRFYAGYGCNPDIAKEGDLNDDCDVNIEDLSMVATQWLDSVLELGADITPTF